MSQTTQNQQSSAEAYYKNAKQVVWVKTRLPTNLADLEELPLPETDRTFVPITFGWVVPGPIDTTRFQEALSHTLADFPHTAGRFHSPSPGVWTLRLTNDAIPVHIASSDNIPDDKFFEEPHTDFFDPQPWLGIVDPPMTDQPLMRIKLVSWSKTGDTSVGVTWCHALGDSGSFFQFFDSMSRRYRGLEPRANPPTFEKYLQPVPDLMPTSSTQLAQYMPHLIHDYTPQSIGEKYTNYMKDSVRVNLHFTSAQISTLYASVSKEAKVKLTSRDVLAGYLVSALNKAYEETLNSLFILVDYRGVNGVPGDKYSPPPRTAVGNAHIVGFRTGIPNESMISTAAIASEIRSVITDIHKPELVRHLFPLEELLRARVIAAKALNWFLPEDGAVGINNSSRIPLTDVDFGYESQSRFYIYEAWERYLRLWQDNPRKRADGTWESNKDGVRVFFRVKRQHVDKLLEIVEEDMQNILRQEVL